MSTPIPPTSSEPAGQRVLVWDLPIRIFHWLLAAAFLLAWIFAVTSDDESRAFAVHGLLGLFIGALVAFRLVWGLIGTRYARFDAFANRPAALVAYLRSVFGGPAREYIGHNPASSLTTWAMLVLLAGLVGTGLLLGRGNESVEDLHEIFAHGMLALVGIHVLGVVLHTIRQRDPITLGMIDGRKRGPASAAIHSARPVSALLLGVLLASWAAGLWRGYDPVGRRVTLPVLGTSVSLGETKEGAHGSGAHGHELD